MRERRSRAARRSVALLCAALLGTAGCKGAANAAKENTAPPQEPPRAAAAEAEAPITVEPVLVLEEPTQENREAMRLLVEESLGWDPEVRDSLATLRRRSREMRVEEKRQAEAAFRTWLLRWKEQNPERAKAAAEIGGERVEIGGEG